MLALRSCALAALALGALLAFACSPTSRGISRSGDDISGTGTVRYFPAEGGFYAIRGDDGETYDPTNLPLELRKDGLRVTFAGKIHDDMISFHAVGPIVELIEIKRR